MGEFMQSIFKYLMVLTIIFNFNLNFQVSHAVASSDVISQVAGVDLGNEQVLESLTNEQLDEIAQNVEEQGKAQDERKLRKFFRKIADGIRSLKKSDDPAKLSEKECKKQRRKEKFNNFLRSIGKGLSWFSITTARPFMNASNFLKGFFEKPEKNQDLEALMKFFVSNEEKLYQAALEATTIDDYIIRLEEIIETIMQDKMRIIVTDILKAQGINIPGMESVVTLEDLQSVLEENDLGIDELLEMASKIENLDPALINEHPEFQDLRGLVGDISKEQIQEFLQTQSFEPSKTIDLEALVKKERTSLIVEGVGTLLGQVFVPKMVIGAISGAAGGVVMGATLVADAGQAISTAICAKSETQAKLDDDAQMANFCRYILYRSSHLLMKSKAKGYLAGKKLKRKMKQKAQERKDRKNQSSSVM